MEGTTGDKICIHAARALAKLAGDRRGTGQASARSGTKRRRPALYGDGARSRAPAPRMHRDGSHALSRGIWPDPGQRAGSAQDHYRRSRPMAANFAHGWPAAYSPAWAISASPCTGWASSPTLALWTDTRTGSTGGTERKTAPCTTSTTSSTRAGRTSTTTSTASTCPIPASTAFPGRQGRTSTYLCSDLCSHLDMSYSSATNII